MICPQCNEKTIPTFDGPQRWCTGCGRLFWMNGDGTIHDTYHPRQKPATVDLEVPVDSYASWYLRHNLKHPNEHLELYNI